VPQHAVLFQVDHEPVVFDYERFENTRIVVLGKTAKISVAAKVVQQIRTDRACDNVGKIRVIALQDLDNGLLKAFPLQDSSDT